VIIVRVLLVIVDLIFVLVPTLRCTDVTMSLLSDSIPQLLKYFGGC
jgi:hypothetical protein